MLAALLRANGIPAALCYQRLTFSHDQPPFCLHALNAFYLPEFGWTRVDARGNKEGVFADFDPPREILAFSTNVDGVIDFEGLYSEPLQEVIELLQNHNDYKAVADNLPDLTVANMTQTPSSLNTK